MIFRLILPIILIFLSELACQDFSLYKKLLDEGKMMEVQKSLPYLSSQYPDHPFVLYLKAAVNNNGEEAIEQFKTIIKDHPGSMASELSIMKIGEYLYSKGLYTQAGEQLKIIPLNYPESKNIERAVNLMKKSYLATGEQDSIEFYIAMFSKKYPQLNFNDYDYFSSIILHDEKIIIEDIFLAYFRGKNQVKGFANLGRISGAFMATIGLILERDFSEIVELRLASVARPLVGLKGNCQKAEVQVYVLKKFTDIDVSTYEGLIEAVQAKKHIKDITHKIYKDRMNKISKLIEQETDFGEDISDAILLALSEIRKRRNHEV